jgi:hypothetical protein
MEENSNILKSFTIQDKLNPVIWQLPKNGDVEKMRPEIRESLLEIAYQFIEFIGVEVFVDDIVMTGSLSNFNWSEYSDVDLHLIIDFDQFPKEQVDLYKELLNLKKIIFNDNHDIKIKKFEVELYAQNSEEAHFSTGEYSVLFDEWLRKPKKDSVKIDTKIIDNKSKQWMDVIDGIIDNASDDDFEETKKIIKKYKEKLKKYRTSGLEKNGEYSNENLVFKLLRRNGYIEKLYNFENKLMDKSLSLENRIEE